MMEDGDISLKIIYMVFSIIGLVLAGIVGVMSLVSRISVKIATLVDKDTSLSDKIVGVNNRISLLEESERKNESFRHKHSNDIKSLQTLVEIIKGDIEKQMVSIKNEMMTMIQQTNELLLTKLDLAIERNKIQKSKNE